ncbi:4098_t:CDS:2, partial [Diversispora eburnea]
SHCPFCTENLPNRETFCEIHYMETTIVPDGIRKGYPMEINFELIESRIIQMKDELLNIIYKKTSSYFRNFVFEICNILGQIKANTPMAIMERFETLKPGYYGTRGMSIITEILNSLFLYTHILTNELSYPKSPVDYILEIMVPETALHLISQDKGGITLEEARKIMEDSSTFESRDRKNVNSVRDQDQQSRKYKQSESWDRRIGINDQ